MESSDGKRLEILRKFRLSGILIVSSCIPMFLFLVIVSIADTSGSNGSGFGLLSQFAHSYPSLFFALEASLIGVYGAIFFSGLYMRISSIRSYSGKNPMGIPSADFRKIVKQMRLEIRKLRRGSHS